MAGTDPGGLCAATPQLAVACGEAGGGLSEHPGKRAQLKGRIAFVLDIPSPCIGVCKLDPATGLCLGCMRTPFEIAIWPKSTNAMRLEIVQRLRERRRAAGRTSEADSRPRRRLRVPV